MKRKITLLISLVVSFCTLIYAQDISIKGTIKDKSGTPIPGVTITTKNSKTGVSSSPEGTYSISVPGNSTLVFSAVGFTPQEVVVNNRTTINISLLESANDLTDVVVIGYGTAQKKDVTGAVSSVKATQLENENPNSVTDILRGNIPGLNVGFNNSAKGGGDLLVRGKTTLTGTTTPLIVLDGVIFIGQLSDINPNDIESVDVLKDASSLAVYGAKAATGVVAITTKKGKTAAPTITLNTNYGFATLAQDQPVYDGPGFLNWRADVARSGGVNPPYIYNDPNNLPEGVTLTQWLNGQTTTNPTDLWLTRLGLLTNEKANYNSGKTVDWYDLLFQTGQRQDHTLSMSGRKEELTYYMSLGYLKNESIIAGGGFSTFRTRINLEGKAAKFLTLGINMQFADRDEGAIEADLGQLADLSPYGDFYNADGSLRRIPTDDNGLNARNPFLNPTYNSRLQKQSTLFGSIYTRVTLPLGITYQLNFSPGLDMYRTFNHLSSRNPNVTTPGGSATRAQETRYNWQLDHLLKWNKTFAKDHTIDVTLLANAEKYQTWYTIAGNEGFAPTDILGYHNISSGNKPTVSSDDKAYTGDALLARINYSYLSKYALTLSIRRDGYSAFGATKKRANFPAAAFAWTFSEESFMKDISWLDYGKLRFSYGINGNREIRDANNVIDPYVSIQTLNGGKYQGVNGSGAAGEVNTVVNSPRLGNPNLEWEKTKSFNLGLDFGIFKNRISGSIDVYDKKTSDLLISQALPNVSGYTNVIANLGRVNNKGIELGLTSKNLTTGNIIWNTAVNLSLNRNKITALATPNDDPGNGWFIGKDIDVIWEYKILGVWQENEVAEANKFNKGIRAGDFKLQDVDGNYVYNDLDKQFIGYRSPRFNWSLRNDFNIYKNFDFSFQLVSSIGQQRTDNQGKNQPGGVGFGRTSSYVVPYWTSANPINDYARLNSGLSGTTFNVYRKSSYVRLNTVALSYNVSKSILEKIKIQSAKIYCNVSNAAVYAPDWNQWDPQTGDGNGNPVPTPRIYTLGLNVSF
ncbi:SusC/RagA family TonB-linked outer membrane protein [Pedobacter mucosus]|uniref:SusC/RagA family TonB-linked outer membrane protein n=1 Tax=Pedobacter mucosus TaxID=2895286 RepID=UPI001EE3DB75|nr:SusC/RagA family TonB-linked outer membrane protein [Pedobacter mucosus]UKT62475.1 SusC/RagA family TonB-linked outer membrane protein [Pedobacter mucosus]